MRAVPLLGIVLLLVAGVAPAAPARHILVIPDADGFRAVLTPASGAGAGSFVGSLSVNGSPSEVPVRGVAQASADGPSVSVTHPYSEVPADWLLHLRATDLD